MPSAEEIRKIIADKQLSGDISQIPSLKFEEGKVNDDGIKLPHTFYDFPGLVKLFRRDRRTVQKWIDLGWLPYYELGKIRIFSDVEIKNMLLRFRRPSLVWLGYFIALMNDWVVSF